MGAWQAVRWGCAFTLWIIGLAGIPDDLSTWAIWIKMIDVGFDNWFVRALLATIGLFLVTYPQWWPRVERGLIFVYGLTTDKWRIWERRSTGRAAWDTPGARTASFKLYEAACLLVGEEPEWPLSTQTSSEEYNALCHAVKTDQLDSPEDSPGFMFGWVLEDDEVHLLELDRKTLRRYLALQNRPAPDFLLEKFDSLAVPPDADKHTGLD